VGECDEEKDEEGRVNERKRKEEDLNIYFFVASN
jgi:hypothetical protein